MDLIQENQYSFTNLSNINVLLGKNGSGKSLIMKNIEQQLKGQDNGEVNYVTPERGGTLTFEASVEQNLQNENWLINHKRSNQWTQFKSYIISQFRKLELLSLREIEQDQEVRQDLNYSFESIINQINSLLTNVRIKRTNKGYFEIFHNSSDKKLDPKHISSGESELIALAIECLTFAKSCQNNQENLLLLDEPDVHLHPDLQSKFINFLTHLVESHNFNIIIATHSTAILGALLNYSNSRFGILHNGSFTVEFKQITHTYRTVLPIFGAHPLSNLFNENPIFLVEGEDEVRIFQQALRTANGSLKLHPCSVGGKGNLTAYENAVIEMINGVYDDAIAYSLRDRDEGEEDINDFPPLTRFKTSCRTAENLILTDEVLENLGTNWEELKNLIKNWVQKFTNHQKYEKMVKFIDEGFNRKTFDLKEIRNIIIGLTPSSKPWEIAVGQVIGRLAKNEIDVDFNENKICDYLGEKLTNKITE